MANKFYLTTSIAYTNASPHIGYALELAQADVVARYHKLSGDNVFFLTGTDEHGIKIQKAAEKERKNPQQFVDELAEKFKDLTKKLNISNDYFVRTTDKKNHWPTVKEVWQKLKEKGDIEKRKYTGFYCVGCEAYLKEKDLIDGKCSIHQKEPEIVEEENYFFKLLRYSSKIKELIEKDIVKIVPETRKNEMLSFISQGLEDISFSRPKEKLNWGIPVPEDNSQTIYVWADALVNYISVLGYPNDKKFKEYWSADIHFVGKDILRFHATIWLGMLLSLGIDLPKQIFVHGFITSNGQKMSKSLGNVIDPFELISKYGTDAVRYFLLSELSPTEDGDFSYEKFEKRYNSDLAGGLGNLVARTLKLAEGIKIENRKNILEEEIKVTKEKTRKFIKEFKFNEALGSIWSLISICNQYIEREKPWESSKEKKDVINNLILTIAEIGELLKPFLPDTADKILTQIKNKKGEILFPRIK